MVKTAFVFPGQGSQFVGMGKDFAENFMIVKRLYENADCILNYKLSSICFEGSDEELMKTMNTQPAILITSIAILRVMETEGYKSDYTAGLSLGEYSALVHSEAIKMEEAIKIIQKRALYMQEAVPIGIGKMAVIIGLNSSKMDYLLENLSKKGVVEIANYNTHEQIVLSGVTQAVKEAIKIARELGAKKAFQIPVSAPFHCSLLNSAGELLKKDLEGLNVEKPKIKFVNNVDAEIISGVLEIKASLVKQVSNSVKWRQTIELLLHEGVTRFLEIGPGSTLSNFIKAISRNLDIEVEVYSISNVEEFKKFLSTINGQ
ncbi:MAG TPA: ACP S-malonyltransferase [Anaerovoracaceae bacterium]|nr:ACP S-malonyltransferase [Anaerovoracaceae bacterium]